MLNKLSQNQFVKITKLNDNTVEYGIVTKTNYEEDEYEVLYMGFLNKNGEFLSYPTEVERILERLKITDAIFEDVKETKIKRKMNKWMDENFDKIVREVH
ncbi:hypothetical protein SAMN05661008_00949 [Alkalithermobacter thermoalcaliphilus JW-YL-7 = DSM 7308]|uniref:Uncharacterized protein n=1 Tax=Alkalithermobacter thermoalcaliphilus JW-YL-7 = DSM 7308 TaxID=1121328 RepID=A0A150FS23_CLOPD|nr:hypothetical protein JWYL7_0905 [[Clostridium] paradoxum JW-YL-7 = DSM 7308]SHK81106.1 hypothetical protein SAMN05661008_00949 [[Clostridium] paradoxum JW-YL-7 = DSM 7308]